MLHWSTSLERPRPTDCLNEQFRSLPPTRFHSSTVYFSTKTAPNSLADLFQYITRLSCHLGHSRTTAIFNSLPSHHWPLHSPSTTSIHPDPSPSLTLPFTQHFNNYLDIQTLSLLYYLSTTYPSTFPPHIPSPYTINTKYGLAIRIAGYH